MLYKNSNFKYCNTVDFQGTIVAFFRDDDSGQIYYDYLELKGTESVDDQSWNGYAPVKFSQPDEEEELRPLGTQLIQLDREITGNDDKGAFQVLSDENYIYLFRGSDQNSIYLNRFVLVTEVDEGADGDSRRVLLPIWEVRYKHSGLRDTPANVRDTQDYRDPTGEPFIEPTLEIPYIYNRQDQDGSWTVLLIPTDVPNRKRWQFFWITSGDTTALSNLCFLQDDDGLMSLDGVDQSDVQKLYLADSEGNKCKFVTSLSTVYYLQQEPYTRAGKKQDQKTTVESQARIMLAAGGKANGNKTPLFALDFGVGFDGNIVKFSNDPDDPFELPPVTVKEGDKNGDGTNSFNDNYEDDQGLTINSWMMNLYEADKTTVVMGGGPDLLSSADGKIHLYFKDNNDNNYLKVVHYEAVRRRVTYQTQWESTSGYSINNEGKKLSGNINFVAKSFYAAKIDGNTNKPEHPMKIKGTSSELILGKTYPISFMYQVTFQKGSDKKETWCGVPDDLGLFVGILNGQALDDPQSSLLLSGQQAFYDYYQKQTLYVFNSQSRGGAGIVSCFENTPDTNPCFTPTLTLDQDGDQWTLDLKQDIILNKTAADNEQTTETITLTEQWPNLDNDTQKFIKTLNGQAPDYKYSDVIFQLGGKNALLYADPSQQRGLWFIACNTDDSDVDLKKIRIIVEDTQTNKPGQAQCKVIIEMIKSDVSDPELVDPDPLDPVTRATWNNVPRPAQEFNNHFQSAINNPEPEQQDVLAVITPYAKGTQDLANVVLHHPADSRGGAFLIATVNYGGEGELQETESSDGTGATTVLMKVNQGRVLSPTLKDNLLNYYDTIPKHSGLFDVVLESFPEDGHPTKVIPPKKSIVNLLNNGYLGEWLTVADNYALEMGHSNKGFTTSTKDDHISLTGEMGIEAWFKVPAAEDDKQAITIVKEKDDDGDKNYSLYVDYYLELDSNNKERVHMELTAYSDDLTGTITFHTYKLDSITQWQHVAAMKQSGFYVDLSPAQVQDPDLTPEQLYLDAGTDTIIGSPNDFTVETLCFIKQNNTEQVIASQWGETPDEQSWKLSIGEDNKLSFYVTQDNGNVIGAESDVAFKDDETETWKHIAAVYSTQSVNKTGLVLTDNQYVYVEEFPGQSSYTSEFWFHRSDPTRTEDLGGLVNHYNDAQIKFSFEGETLYYYSHYDDNPDKQEITTSGIQILEVNHFAYTYGSESKQINIYLNGMLLDTLDTSNWDEGFMSDDEEQSEFGFADFPQDDKPLQGFMTDIRVWTVERTREEVALSMDKRLLGNEDGLWCYLPLDNFTTTKLESEVGDRTLSQGSGTLEFSAREFANCSASIYVNGKIEKVTTIKDAAIANSTAPVLFGRQVTGKALSGGVDGIRLWDAPRPNWAIDLYRMNNLDSSLRLVKGDKKGLLADWAFSDKDGTVATDRVYNSPLIVKSMVTGKETRLSPSDFYFANYYRAQWHIYLDGKALNVNQTMSDDIDKVVQQNNDGSGTFLLGETKSNDKTVKFYLDDVRLWGGVRTAEQVRDNMYRRLNTDERNLSAYWMFGDFLQEKDQDSDQVNWGFDYSGNGHSLDITENNVKQDQSVPVCDEHPVVQNAMGGAKMPQNAKLTRSISVVEYSDMEQDYDGNLFAVLKRAYVFADKGKGGINLVSGFKVDNLEMIYLGMAQTQPTLIGYLEGPPPVPSENLTRPYWTRFNTDEYTRYNDACSIQLTEALDTTYHYSSQKGNPATTNWELKGGVAFKKSIRETIAPTAQELATGKVTEVLLAEIEANIGAVLKGSESSGTPKSLSKSVALSKHLTEQMTLQGGWEPLSQLADNQDLGDRRFIPANKGYALVKSSTATVYLARLKRTKMVVNTLLVPNPNTPEDWNIITFPIDPKYVKNGTLDGRVGFKSDPDYKHTSERDLVYNEQENSYFKPREAYAIKQRIERDEKRLEAFYERLNQRYIGKKVDTSTQLRGLGNTENAQNVPDAPGYDWDKKLSKRNLVNTYVWSADLGFFAEENQTMDMREESLGASYGMQLEGGIEGSIKALFGFGATIGAYASASVLAGKNLNVSIAKNKEESDGFGMDVGVTADDLLNKWLGVDPNARQELGKPIDPKYQEMDGYSLEAEPGKVQSYRFNSFYLAPHEKNWNDFYKKVVDPAWLRNSNDPNARALRETKPHKNGVWRVMHRVTYVERIPPHYLNAPVEELDDPANVPANLEDNTIIIDLVKSALDSMSDVDDTSNPSRANIADAVFHVLGYEEENGSVYTPVTGTIAQTYAWWTSYWNPGSLTPEQETIRKNITGYMLKYYDTASMSVIAQEAPTEKEERAASYSDEGD
jgi:hypothetical protein